MVDPLVRDPNYRWRHAVFMARWWGGHVLKGVRDPHKAAAALCEAIGWASR